MREASGTPPETSRPVRYRDGVTVYGYRTDPVTPPVSVWRFTGQQIPDGVRPHIHDFPALLYVPGRGDVYVVAAGQVVERPAVASIGAATAAAAVFFDPAIVGDRGGQAPPGWRTHPLLFPFTHTAADGLLRLRVPRDRRALWAGTIAALESELVQHRIGHRQAAQAHLTVLLIDIARLAADAAPDLPRGSDPMLAAVFDIIERRYGERLSLRDVARQLNMTPGHLTTVVGRRTGRTVQDWITERRMVEARALLADTDLPIAEIARRVGLLDPAYFTRLFRRTHNTTPRHWRASTPHP